MRHTLKSLHLYMSASAIALLLTGCSWFRSDPSEDELPPTEEPPIVEEDELDTTDEEDVPMENVTEEGIVEKAGISIYMEGTHKLILDEEGGFLLLESSSADLNGYIGERVQVRGDIRKTVEAGGMIMDVEEIHLLEESAASSSEAILEATSSAESMAESAASSESPKEVIKEEPEEEVTEDMLVDSGESSAVDARSEKMAKDDVSDPSWTQQYCTSHIGFCVPVHKNWWFKSFGATTTYLWHVEFGPEELFDLGDGPLVLNLVSGTITEKGASENELRSQGDFVVGYHSWTENRHFEISGPSSLRSAVDYMTRNLALYEEP